MPGMRIRLTSKSGALRRCIAGALWAALAAGSSQGLAYPDKPVRFVVPFPPGGITDVVARILSKPMSESMGQPVIVDNKGGAGGTIGTEAIARSAPDGYTVGVISSSHSTSAALYRKLRFDPLADFAPVTRLVSVSFCLMVSPEFKVGSVKDLIELARKQPLTYGSGGLGNTQHLAGQLLNTMAGINMQHVPYKGGGPALVGLLGGQVSILFAPIDVALQHVPSGKLRALAVADRTRSSLLPTLPTMAESGLPGYEVMSWLGVVLPARTPGDIVARLNREFAKALGTKEIREQMLKLGAEPVADSPAEFGAFLRADIDKWTRVVKQSGIQPFD